MCPSAGPELRGGRDPPRPPAGRAAYAALRGCCRGARAALLQPPPSVMATMVRRVGTRPPGRGGVLRVNGAEWLTGFDVWVDLVLGRCLYSAEEMKGRRQGRRRCALESETARSGWRCRYCWLWTHTSQTRGIRVVVVNVHASGRGSFRGRASTRCRHTLVYRVQGGMHNVGAYLLRRHTQKNA